MFDVFVYFLFMYNSVFRCLIATSIMINSINTSSLIKGTLSISVGEMDHAAIQLPSKINYTKVQAFSSDFPILQTGSIKNYMVRSRSSSNDFLAYDIFMLWISPVVAIACFAIDSFVGMFLERDRTQMSVLLENQPLAEAEEDLQKRTNFKKGRLCIPIELQIERQSNKEVRVYRTVFEQHRTRWISRAPSFEEIHKHPPQIVARVSEEAWRIFQKGISRKSYLGANLPMDIKVLPSDVTYYQKTWFQKVFGR